MKSKFLDTLFDNILIWLGPRKRKREDISFDSEYPRIPDPSKKVFKSADSFNQVIDAKQTNQNGNCTNHSSEDMPQIIHSVIQVKNNTSPRKDAQYQIIKKDIIDQAKENTSQKSKNLNSSAQKTIASADNNNTLKKNELQLLFNRNDAQPQEIILIEEDEVSEIGYCNGKETIRRQSSASFLEQSRKEREAQDLDLIQLSGIFMEFKELTDEWVSSDLDFIQEKMANLDLMKENISEIKQGLAQQQKSDDEFPLNSIFQTKQTKTSKINQLLEEFNQIYELKTKKQKAFFWRFEESQIKRVQDVFDRSYNLNLEVVTYSHILEKLSFTNLQTLSKTNWLNDEVINAYIRLITQSTNSVVLNSFFYPELTKNNVWNKIKRIATKNKVQSKSGSFYVPLNINGNHWAFAEINNDKKEIIYFDSLASSDRDYSQYTQYFIDFMINLQKDDGVTADNIKQYKLVTGCTGNQQNGFDCGIFMLKGIHYRSAGITGLDLWIDQSDTHYYRYQIAYQLIQGKIETNL